VRAARPILFLVSLLLNAALLWHFHDRYWYPTDDGFYAHIAERLLDGEVLNRDIQDIHPGYINFLHATAFRLFGLDIVSLRYPLVLASLLLCGFTFAVSRSTPWVSFSSWIPRQTGTAFLSRCFWPGGCCGCPPVTPHGWPGPASSSEY
jgi:hypothetical protein